MRRVAMRYVLPPTTSSLKDIETYARPLTLPGRRTVITWPRSSLPAGITTLPPETTLARTRASTRSSGWLEAEETVVSSVTGIEVSAGSWRAAATVGRIQSPATRPAPRAKRLVSVRSMRPPCGARIRPIHKR
jgi:hypothetical protein